MSEAAQPRMPAATAVVSPPAAPRGATTLSTRQKVVRSLVHEILNTDPEFLANDGANAPTFNGPLKSPRDILFGDDSRPIDPDQVHRALRWGGQFVYIGRHRKATALLAQRFVERGFELSRQPAFVRKPMLGVRLPLLSRKVHYFVARRTSLTLPKEFSERFTYHVRLTRELPPGVTAPPSSGGYVVLKEVPSVERVSARLRHKFPEAAADLIEKRARKFTEKIFPVFLTREAAMLKILERDLPPTHRDRVPHVLHMEQDDKGYVRRLWMNWMRAGTPQGRPLSQMEFALQATELLRAIHDNANVIHLDLRLDNVVITDGGVGFVDFGSAVREGENIQGNPLLSTIFDELMKTSQIQRMLDRMMSNGSVTSSVLGNAYGKVDKGVDLFYLALSINAPLTNPDFAGLVDFAADSESARALERLTQDVLKPKDPSRPTIRSAGELLQSIETLDLALKATLDR